MGHKSIKRIFKRSLEELSATYKIAKQTSISEAINTFRAKIDIQVMNRNGYKETDKIKERLIKKHSTMLNYIEKEYKVFLEKYDFENVSLEVRKEEYLNKVWICWWQGVENAPEIVKACINSIRNHTKGHEIIVITDENVNEYVQFPEWLEEKRRKGIISRTHYSDLLRVEILARYGGVWLDSTFFCSGGNIDDYFKYPLWSIKRPEYFHASVASGYFANYSLGCTFENRRVYAVIRDFLMYYWQNNDEIIDYLLTDYLIVLAQKYDKEIDRLFKEIPNNNPNCDELFKILQESYNEEKWNEIKKDTNLFKLTWKQEFLMKKDEVKTFYGKLISNELK